MMELKRASIITTPDVTPRNSMLFGINQAPSQINLPDQLELQDFLKNFHRSDDTMSIPEVDDEEEDDEDSEENGGEEHDRYIGSLTPNESTNRTIKTFDLSVNNNSSNNNNNNNNNDNGLEKLSPLNVAIPRLLSPLSSAGVSSNDIITDLSINSDTYADLSQSSEPPFLTTHPLPHPPPRSHSISGCSTEAKLRKHKLYSSSVDLSVKHSMTLHKSSDNIFSSTGLDKIAEASPRSRFSTGSLLKLKGLSMSPDKENGSKPDKSRRKLFGGMKKIDKPTSTTTPSSGSRLTRPPSIKNKIVSPTTLNTLV